MIAKISKKHFIMRHKTYLLRRIYNILIDNFLQKLSRVLDREILGRPFAIHIYPTYRCNLRCRQCNYYKRYFKELSIEKWKEIIINLKRWMGNFCLRITGGEPFMREDLIEIIRFSHQLGIMTAVATNGTLIDKDNVNKILESGLDTIYISLDGIKEETHDFLRGLSGAYRKVMQAIKLLKGGIKLQINTTIMNNNLDEIIGLVEFAEKNGLKISFQGLYIQVDDKTNSFDLQNYELWPKDKKKLDDVFAELLFRKKKNSNIFNSIRHLQLIHSYYNQPQQYINYRCQAHRTNFRIMPNGDVHLCHKFNLTGNVTIGLPQNIWSSEETNLIRERMKHCWRNCSFSSCYHYETLREHISKFKGIFFSSC
jgi:radical SAM protein with 4Fe4S-binding SPASM domain